MTFYTISILDPEGEWRDMYETDDLTQVMRHIKYWADKGVPVKATT
jgi:hypothetical protein